jgi:outer membrane protein assembly factor BamB
MGFLMARTTGILLLCVMLQFSCNKLRIKDFPDANEPMVQPMLTLQFNYQRNALTDEEVAPPLVLQWEESLPSIPNKGFAISDNYALFGMTNGYLAALEVGDGSFLGKKNLGDGCPAPPTIYGTIAYQSFETGKSGLIAYDLPTGGVLWELPGQFSTSNPVILDERLFHQTAQGMVFCLDYRNGGFLWQKYTGHAVRNALAYSDGILISAASDGFISAIIHRTGVMRWQTTVDGPVFADPVIADGRVYIAGYDGFLTILDLATGTIVKRIPFEVPLYQGPTIDAGTIYFGVSNGTFYAIDRRSFEIRYRFNGQGPVSAPPLVSESYIYFTTLARHLYVLKKSDGQLLQDIEFDGRARSTPIIKNNTLIIASDAKAAFAYVQNF